MASDDLWILGIHMTKFGKHPDLDTVDLASEAAIGALADGGVTMKDIGVLGGRQPDGGQRRHRPAAAEADRPDGHPRLQRGQRLRHRRHRPADRRSWRSRPASATWAWPSGWRSWRGPACWPAAAARTTGTPGPARAATAPWHRSTGASAPRSCPACSPRSAWSTATSTAAPASSCSPGSARRTTPTRPSTRWPPTRRR